MVLPPPAARWVPDCSTQEHGTGERLFGFLQKHLCSHESPWSWDGGEFREGMTQRQVKNHKSPVKNQNQQFWFMPWEPAQTMGDTRWAVTQPQGPALLVLCWEAARPALCFWNTGSRAIPSELPGKVVQVVKCGELCKQSLSRSQELTSAGDQSCIKPGAADAFPMPGSVWHPAADTTALLMSCTGLWKEKLE